MLTPLTACVAANFAEGCVLLLNARADALFRQPESGWTALHSAVSCGAQDCCSVLLAGRAEGAAATEVRDRAGRTPLDLARATPGAESIAAILSTPHSQAASTLAQLMSRLSASPPQQPPQQLQQQQPQQQLLLQQQQQQQQQQPYESFSANKGMMSGGSGASAMLFAPRDFAPTPAAAPGGRVPMGPPKFPGPVGSSSPSSYSSSSPSSSSSSPPSSSSSSSSSLPSAGERGFKILSFSSGGGIGGGGAGGGGASASGGGSAR